MISTICYWISQIDKDKILHYFISYLICDISLSIMLLFSIHEPIALIYSVCVTSLFAFVKETIDQITYKGWDWYDILADYLGLITKTILFVIPIL